MSKCDLRLKLKLSYNIAELFGKLHNYSRRVSDDIKMQRIIFSVFGILYTILQRLTATSAHTPADQNNSIYFVSGAHIINLTNPLYYDTFVPIIYGIELPQFNPSDLKIEWPNHNTSSCPSSGSHDSSKIECQIWLRMQNVTDHFLETLSDWKSFNSSKKTKPILLKSCQNISPHFNSYFMGHEEWNEYFFEDLKNCPLGQQTIYEKVSISENEVNATFYSTMFHKYLEDTATIFKFSNPKHPIDTNAFLAIQSLELLDYINMHSRWSDAKSTCDNGKIPYSLISKEKLGSSLREIVRRISSKEGYKLTIDPEDYSTYFKLPLADCAFSTKNTLLVRILVPVSKASFQYSLALVKSIPFLRKDGDVSEICEYTKSAETVLLEETTGALIPSDCKEGELCLIPDMANRPVTDYCLSALMQNSTDKIIAHCAIQCKHFETRELPYFRRLSSDKYVVLGKSDMDIFVSCDTQPFKVLTPPRTVGALEITLPCSCQLVHKREALHSMSPCGKDLLLREIMPILWSPQSVTGKNNPAFIYDHIHLDGALDIEKDHKKSTGLTSPRNLPFAILSFLVVFLLCSNAFLFCIFIKIYKRVTRLEQLNVPTVGCNFYETPMFVRANDD